MIRFWILFGLLAGSATFSLAHLRSSGKPQTRVDLAALVPLRLQEWTGRDLGLDPGTQKLLGANTVLLRSYERPGHPPVMLCITFTGGSHRMTHPAEVCYEGQGWEISRNEEEYFLFSGTPPVEKKINHLTVSREERILQVIVWYRTSRFETTSYFRQKLAMLLKPLLGGDQWSAMIRLSAPEDPAHEHTPLESMAAVGGALLPWLDELEQRAGDS